MATTQQTKTPTFEGLFERTTQAQEEWGTAARKAGNAYLDSYEKAVDRALDVQLRVADGTGQGWLKSIAEAQADLARELTHTYTSTARTLLK